MATTNEAFARVKIDSLLAAHGLITVRIFEDCCRSMSKAFQPKDD